MRRDHQPVSSLFKCDDLSVCYWCGYTGDIARVIHSTKYLDFDHYDSDANYHWKTCAHCGEKVDVRVHQVHRVWRVLQGYQRRA